MNIIKKYIKFLKNEIIHSVPSHFIVGDSITIVEKCGATYQVTIDDIEMYKDGWIYIASNLIGRDFKIKYFPYTSPINPVIVQHYSSYDGQLLQLKPVFDLAF